VESEVSETLDAEAGQEPEGDSETEPGDFV